MQVIEGPWSAEPICSEHDIRVTKCVPCCVRLFEEAGSMGDVARHSWAMANVYKAKELW